jgi:hypothetical protein
MPFKKAFVFLLGCFLTYTLSKFSRKNLTFYDFHLARIEIRICIYVVPRIRFRIEIKAGSRSALKPMRTTLVLICSLARMEAILLNSPFDMAPIDLDCIWNEDTGAQCSGSMTFSCGSGTMPLINGSGSGSCYFRH